VSETSKRCSTCKRVQPVSAFNARNAAKDGLQARCRDCAAEWYQRNRDQHLRNVAARNERVRLRNRELLLEYLQSHSCVDCGETDIRCLEFDHRDPSSKRAMVTRLAALSFDWAKVLEEIAKCDVRCTNCHRKRTAEMLGWERHRLQLELDTAARELATSRLSGLAIGSPAGRQAATPVRPRTLVAPGVWQQG
jgi:hypothetical protein